MGKEGRASCNFSKNQIHFQLRTFLHIDRVPTMPTMPTFPPTRCSMSPNAFCSAQHWLNILRIRTVGCRINIQSSMNRGIHAHIHTHMDIHIHMHACIVFEYSFRQFTVAAVDTRRPYCSGVRMWSKCQLQNNCILVTLLLNPEFRWQPTNQQCDGFR